jgi:hypothetical protein
MESLGLDGRGMPTLDTQRNADAALLWARQYGVLGLGNNVDESFGVSSSVPSSPVIVVEALDPQGLRSDLAYADTRGFSKGRRGGQHETVEKFALEAREANFVL